MQTFKFNLENTLMIGKMWDSPTDQLYAWTEDEQIRMSTLIEQCKDLPVMDIPLEHLSTYRFVQSGDMGINDFVSHCHHVFTADLNYPIILAADGLILDGCHRVIRALLEGRETIKAVRMIERPITEKS